MARHGEARTGWAWSGVVRQAWIGADRRGQARLGKVWFCKAGVAGIG